MRFGCFVSHSPLIVLITKAESPYTCKNLILKSIEALIPMMHASYSAMLLVQLKHNLAVKGVCPPVCDVMMAPTPLQSAFKAPSKTIVHRDRCSDPSSGPGSSQSVTSKTSSSGNSNRSEERRVGKECRSRWS